MTAIRKASLTVISAAFAFFALAVTANAQDARVASPEVVAVANAKTVAYNLAAGAISAPITVPANVPVHLVGIQTFVGFRGVGGVELLSIPGSFLEWVGLNSTSSGAIVQGFSGSPGTHIVFIDFSQQVDVQVASPTAIQINNLSGGTRTGYVTMFW
jgi:hypothetical protein